MLYRSNHTKKKQAAPAAYRSQEVIDVAAKAIYIAVAAKKENQVEFYIRTRYIRARPMSYYTVSSSLAHRVYISVANF